MLNLTRECDSLKPSAIKTGLSSELHSGSASVVKGRAQHFTSVIMIMHTICLGIYTNTAGVGDNVVNKMTLAIKVGKRFDISRPQVPNVVCIML